MAESKDMHSSSPARAPKLQLAVEQPLTGECCKPPKRIPHVQKQRSHSKMVVGVQTQQNQIPYPPGGWPTDWRTIIPKKFSHYCKHSRLHIRLHNLGVRQRDREFPGIWLWRAAGFHYRTSTGLREQRLLEGINKTLYTQGPRGKE